MGGKPKSKRDTCVVAVRLRTEEMAALIRMVGKAIDLHPGSPVTPASFLRRLVLQAAARDSVEPVMACDLPQDRRFRGVEKPDSSSLQGCQSEDEVMLLEALLVVFTKEGTVEEPVLGEYRGTMLYRQYRTCGYVLDFAVLGGNLRLAIEVDGPHHDYFGQARKDRRRDRILTKAGWRMLRFTTQEVVEDNRRCVQEVVALVDDSASGSDTQAPLVNNVLPPSEPPLQGGLSTLTEADPDRSEGDDPDRLTEADLAAMLDPGPLEPGSKVTPLDGVYAGVRGLVVKILPGDRVAVEFITARGDPVTANYPLTRLRSL